MQNNIIAFPAKEVPAYTLPIALTPLIGRERELLKVRTMLVRQEVRLLTLTGTGGVGKTRLAMEIAHSVQDEFADGVCFVSLAPLSDAEHVMPSIAQALGLRDAGDRPLLEQIQGYLQDRHLLLVLDNFEQVMVAAPHLLDLLMACPDLHLLVTSRATLHLPGEHEYPVPPLGIPDLTQQLDEQVVAHAAAVQLFMQRARAVQPTFRLTATNAVAVAAICARLDGLPLALELAAARIKLLPPQALLKRLESPLNVLTRGSSSLPSRQQTIRSTIQWSYDLLDRWEQRLFRLCAVFVDGFTLQAVEAVCLALHESGTEMGSVLEGVDSLVNKSLLQAPGQEDAEGEPRLRMLETVREYGREMLLEKGEMEAARQAHATCFLQFAEAADGQTGGIKQLARDYENMRAALAWMLEVDHEGQRVQRVEMALRLCCLLWPLWSTWVMQVNLSEGWAVMERALAQSEKVAPELRAQSLFTASNFLRVLGDYNRSEAVLEQSLALYKELGNTEKSAYCLQGLGATAYLKNNLSRAQTLYEESLALYRALNDQRGIASLLSSMAFLAQYQADYERAFRLFSESLALFRKLGDIQQVAGRLFLLAQLLCMSHEQPPAAEIRALLDESMALAQEIGNKRLIAVGRSVLGSVAFSQGDLETAYLLVNEAMSFLRKGDNRKGIGEDLTTLARIVTAQGDYTSATALFAESLAIGREVNDTLIIAMSLEGMAQLAAAREQRVWAVRLCGAAERLREALGIPMSPFERFPYQRAATALRAYFGEQVFAKLWAEGQAMTPDEALAIQGAELPGHTAQPAQKITAYPDGLSAREVEVLRLLAQGDSDAQIADHLIISVRTVNTHLTSIYRKIQVTTRSAATRYTIDHQLL